MNSTINQTRMNNSKPSFGSFSPAARQYINKNTAERLIKKGISLADFKYIENHSLEIGVAEFTSFAREGKGLFIMNPFNTAYQKYGYTSKASHDIRLTPIKATYYLNTKFKDIEETLPKALKKAIKIIRKFDAIAKEKNEYFAKFGNEINKLKSSIGHNEAVYNNNLDAFLSKVESSERDNSVELLKEIKKDSKQLKRYHDPEYFDKKQQKLFL